ncbi:hypothetical protein NPIL_575951, partial [Nephila pilipes]
IRLDTVTFDSPPVRLPPHVPDIDIDAFDDKTVQTIRAAIENRNTLYCKNDKYALD